MADVKEEEPRTVEHVSSLKFNPTICPKSQSFSETLNKLTEVCHFR